MIWDILFIFSLVGLASLPILRLLWKSEIEQCRYDMFSVRDDLVLLAAKGIINKDDSIFNFYYTKSSKMLRFTEKMHLEGLIQFLLDDKASISDVKAYKQRMDEVIAAMNAMPEDNRAETIAIATRYYDTINKMIWVTSNRFVVVYKIISEHRKLLEQLHVLGLVERVTKNVPAVEAMNSVQTEKDQIQHLQPAMA